MPLNTQVRRGKKIRKDITWDAHALNCFLTVGLSEGDPWLFNKCILDPTEPFTFEDADGNVYEKPLNFMMVPVYYLNTKADLWVSGKHIVQRNHVFAGVVFTAGDILEMWRSY